MERLLVLPRKTRYSPPDAWVGEPDLFAPHPDLVEISCVFTWDVAECLRLKAAWEGYAKQVLVGGPGFGDDGGAFVPGRFVKLGVTYTSRGCPRRCSWCYVPQREGSIRELDIAPGNIVQDNNLLACSREHIEKVFRMLESQRAIKFSGGLDHRLLRQWHLEAISALRLDEVWLAYDHKSHRKSALKAIELARKYFSREKVRCYVMVGKDEDIAGAEQRLREAYNAGALPFCQVWDKVWSRLDDRRSWRMTARVWQRPAIYRSVMRREG